MNLWYLLIFEIRECLEIHESLRFMNLRDPWIFEIRECLEIHESSRCMNPGKFMNLRDSWILGDSWIFEIHESWEIHESFQSRIRFTVSFHRFIHIHNSKSDEPNTTPHPSITRIAIDILETLLQLPGRSAHVAFILLAEYSLQLARRKAPRFFGVAFGTVGSVASCCSTRLPFTSR